MRKTFVIAARDYLAAVKTKSFLISLAFVPVLAFGGYLVGQLSQNVVDTSEKRIAVIDRSAEASARAATRPAAGAGGGVARMAARAAGLDDDRPLYQILIEAAQERDAEIRGPDGEPAKAPYVLEPVAVDDGDPAALEARRLELSEQVRDGELFAFVEIGPSVVATSPDDLADLMEAARRAEASAREMDLDADDPMAVLTADLPPELQELQDQYGVRYSSKSTTNPEVLGWIRSTLTPVVQYRKLEGLAIPPDRFAQLMQPLAINQRALAVRGEDGAVEYEDEPNPIAGMLVPFFSVFLLFSLIATAAFPLTTNIIEEKQLRIAEVLLGSVRPFELMLGKLLGGVAISLTLAAIYGAGVLFLAAQFDIVGLLGWSTIAWFLVFAALATLMVGAMSVAAGAAVTNLKEAQNIQTPIVLLPMLPALVAINVAQNPQGPIAQAFTWFPLTTPITSVMRITIRDGMPTWERFAAAGLSVLTTVFLVWLAGRIFRHGMLKSEKAAAFGDVLRWVTRG